jgi:hypothetical protein
MSPLWIVTLDRITGVGYHNSHNEQFTYDKLGNRETYIDKAMATYSYTNSAFDGKNYGRLSLFIPVSRYRIKTKEQINKVNVPYLFDIYVLSEEDKNHYSCEYICILLKT